ncbi:homoprotocatechuate degradation operon regulator HpaR [Breoghania sp.]|uniref:homoprotocatechuate degradation operon regulator HpaR n=1 Tax=Breoghania sp. TaxID=2065378 RepID=UPI002631BB0D|nr:homoprotocatechuate degradation operon regulator HpaR [Breoghania sp.]MDJ0933277.1 homoprotocatechuate degradation operon regulator HpaR [Breoghania sp.]
MSQTPPLRKTARSLPIALLHARETVMGPIREMLAKSGISEQKWRVLRVLDEMGPVEQTAIAEAACLLLPSLTRILSSMEGDGYLLRRPDAHDRRKSIVELTDGGRELIARHAEESHEIMSRLERRFGQENVAQLLDLLDDLRAVEGER